MLCIGLFLAFAFNIDQYIYCNKAIEGIQNLLSN